MAFSLQGFGAGFASRVSSRMDEERVKEDRAKEKAEDLATKQRLATQSKRNKEKAIMSDLTENLAVFYTPEQVEDILSNGKGAAKHAITMGAGYSAEGMDPSEYYSMPNNAIVDTGADVVQIGEISREIEKQGSFSGRFKPIGTTKQDKTLASYELSLLNMRLDAGNDPEKLAAVEEKERIFIDLQQTKAEATRKVTPEKDTFYTPTEREAKKLKYITLAQNAMDIETGSMGELGAGVQAKLTGTNKLSMANLLAAKQLKVNNDLGVKEPAMYGEITALAANTIDSLQQYAARSVSKITRDRVFASKEELEVASAAGGTIKPGDVYVFLHPATVEKPAYYIAGTFISKAYETSLGLESFQNAINLGPNWIPTGAN